jgi:hypothetical protein
MLSEELNNIVNNQIAESTTFWAGKLKLTEQELQAIADFAKKKGDIIDKALSSSDSNIESLIKAALNNSTKK